MIGDVPVLSATSTRKKGGYAYGANPPPCLTTTLALQLAFALAAVPLRTALFLLALLAFGDKVHLFAKRFGDPLCDYAFVEAANKLFDRFAVTSFYAHSIRLWWSRSPSETTPPVPRSPPYNHKIRLVQSSVMLPKEAKPDPCWVKNKNTSLTH